MGLATLLLVRACFQFKLHSAAVSWNHWATPIAWWRRRLRALLMVAIAIREVYRMRLLHHHWIAWQLFCCDYCPERLLKYIE
jgi:hypothetical protein